MYLLLTVSSQSLGMSARLNFPYIMLLIRSGSACVLLCWQPVWLAPACGAGSPLPCKCRCRTSW